MLLTLELWDPLQSGQDKMFNYQPRQDKMCSYQTGVCLN